LLRLLELAVEEDLGRLGDCTTLALVPADAWAGRPSWQDKAA